MALVHYASVGYVRSPTMVVTASELRAEFERNGIAGPIRVLDVRQAALAIATLRAELQAQALRFPERPPVLAGWHTWSIWTHDIAAHPILVQAIEIMLGASCQIWASELWIKTAWSEVRVPWHQDDVFWPAGAELPTVSAWVALTEASPSNGGLQLVRGSHERRWKHVPVDASRGGLDHGIDPGDLPPEQIWSPTLSPGEAILFDSRVVHGSPANPSQRDRVALSLRYTLASVPVPAGVTAVHGSSTYDQRPPA